MQSVILLYPTGQNNCICRSSLLISRNHYLQLNFNISNIICYTLTTKGHYSQKYSHGIYMQNNEADKSSANHKHYQKSMHSYYSCISLYAKIMHACK